MHNEKRRQHGSNPLTLDSQLAAHAEKQAKHVASIGKMEHDMNTDEGENIYYNCQPDQPSGDNATESWYMTNIYI